MSWFIVQKSFVISINIFISQINHVTKLMCSNIMFNIGILFFGFINYADCDSSIFRSRDCSRFTTSEIR